MPRAIRAKPVFFCALLGLAGACVNMNTYYKTGTTMEAISKDDLACARQADIDVPPRIIVENHPVYGPPPKPGAPPVLLYWRTEYIDINEGRRARAKALCMAEAGYDRVSIPYCTDEQIDGRAFRPLAKTPPLDGSICAVRRDGKRLLIDLDKPL
ncbi:MULTISPECIES: hypothetical protein [Shimia]|uniref:hypothetical protein n=1 Tax=Shimia TaxID=573139 RepID=UPI001FB1B20C|nr:MULTISPECIES: hypothetical protein [Shimia]MDV4144144.1 hypothetical protein [Shimia sp. FJ5]